MTTTTNTDFAWHAEPWGHALRCAPLLAAAPHLFTSRVLPLAGDGGDAARAWEALARSMDAAPHALVRLKQVHGTDTVVCREAPTTGSRPPADIALTDNPDLVLTVQAADCVPLLLADRRTGAVGAAHAGWRGTATGAAGTVVGAMAEAFGTRPADLIVAIGPSIGPCCYEVGPEVREAFLAAHGGGVAAPWFAARGNGTDRWVLDLWRANRDQLAAAGVPMAHVHVAALCTVHHPDRLCSYRRDGQAAGRMAGAIRMRTER